MNLNLKKFLEIECAVILFKSSPLEHIFIKLKKAKVSYDLLEDIYLISPYKQPSIYIHAKDALEAYNQTMKEIIWAIINSPSDHL